VTYQQPMLKTIRAGKQFHILAFLALFYFVIGAHALHPHFHKHNSTVPINLSQHIVPGVHTHSIISGLVLSDHQPCPICNFFALNTAVKTNTVCFFIPSIPDLQQSNDYPIAVIFTHQTSFQIRGPPITIPA
jgi:hypothetical protein